MSIELAILELARSIQNLADSNTGNVMLSAVVNPDADAVEAVEAVEAEKVEAKKAPAKKAPAKKKVEPVAEVEDEDEKADGVDIDAVHSSKPKTKEDVIEAATAVRDAVGRDGVVKALKAFKASKISDLDPANYAVFIRHCEDMIENADIGE